MIILGIILYFVIYNPSDGEPITNIIYNVSFTPSNLNEKQKAIIAHAGGSLNVDGTRYTYSNSYKAIKNSYENGTRLCEIDFLKTVDGYQVAFHSWDGFLTKFFGVESKDNYTHDEFMSFNMIGDAGQLDLEKIITIMNSDFPELILVTDTKDDNLTLLTEIKEKYPKMMARIIPQVYNQDEFKKAKEMGFENIIYTLYESPDTDEEVVEFCKNNPLFAITMPSARATEEFVASLKNLNVYVYCHTIDSIEDFNYLRNKKVDGIYTNDLINIYSD
jgi:glycerophosphoryl diester phosphodiesterase